jgi:hypothetical protein
LGWSRCFPLFLPLPPPSSPLLPLFSPETGEAKGTQWGGNGEELGKIRRIQGRKCISSHVFQKPVTGFSEARHIFKPTGILSYYFRLIGHWYGVSHIGQPGSVDPGTLSMAVFDKEKQYSIIFKN